MELIPLRPKVYGRAEYVSRLRLGQMDCLPKYWASCFLQSPSPILTMSRSLASSSTLRQAARELDHPWCMQKLMLRVFCLIFVLAFFVMHRFLVDSTVFHHPRTAKAK